MKFWLDDTINTSVVHIVQSKLFDLDQMVTSVLTVSFDLKKKLGSLMWHLKIKQGL